MAQALTGNVTQMSCYRDAREQIAWEFPVYEALYAYCSQRSSGRRKTAYFRPR